MIKNGTLKDRRTERKIWSLDGRTSTANKQWESIKWGRARENWWCGEGREGEKRWRRWKDDLVGEQPMRDGERNGCSGEWGFSGMIYEGEENVWTLNRQGGGDEDGIGELGKRGEEKSLWGGQARPYIRPRLLGTALALPHLLPKAGRPGGVCVCTCMCVFVYVCVNNIGQMEQRWYRPVPCRGTHTYKAVARTRSTHTRFDSHTPTTPLRRFHDCPLWQTTQF